MRPIYRTNSISAAIAAARAGIGLAPLPCAVADRTPDLVRIAMFPEDFRLDLWLLTHEDLRNTARIRAFMDFMANALATDADVLEGRRPQAGPPRTTTP
jgi:DNA-binding transcriptional LysR family regulator